MRCVRFVQRRPGARRRDADANVARAEAAANEEQRRLPHAAGRGRADVAGAVLP